MRETLHTRMVVDEMHQQSPGAKLDPEDEDEASTARVLNNPFFSAGAKAKRRATWERLRGGAHGAG